MPEHTFEIPTTLEHRVKEKDRHKLLSIADWQERGH